MLRLALLACALAVVVSGCDDSSPPPARKAEAAPRATPAPPRDTAVIRAWAKTLRAGRVGGAARRFAVPSVAANGGPAITLLSRRDVRLFNASLPCGAVLLSTRRVAGFTVATFRLTERPGPGSCGPGTGRRAATAFKIRSGKIFEWRRVAIPPGPPPEKPPSPEV